MRIIKDVEPVFEADKYDVALIGTSVYDILSSGFQGKMANRYPHIAEANHKQPYGDLRRIGTRLTLNKEGCPTLSLLYICGYPKKGLKTLNYDALEKCLLTSAAEFKGKRIITTIMGSTVFDGEGNKRKILRMMEKAFEGMDVDVYDYKQRNVIEERREKQKQMDVIGFKDKTKRKEILKKLFLIPNNG